MFSNGRNGEFYFGPKNLYRTNLKYYTESHNIKTTMHDYSNDFYVLCSSAFP